MIVAAAVIEFLAEVEKQFPPKSATDLKPGLFASNQVLHLRLTLDGKLWEIAIGPDEALTKSAVAKIVELIRQTGQKS